MAFTVVFNDDGTISNVFKGTHGGPPADRVHPDPAGIGHLPAVLQGSTVSNTVYVQIIVTVPDKGGADPCIIQGGQLWCW
jgi:hypothetical protein